MEQLNLITNFLRIKDKNITITDEYDMGTHLELHGHLDYQKKWTSTKSIKDSSHPLLPKETISLENH